MMMTQINEPYVLYVDVVYLAFLWTLSISDIMGIVYIDKLIEWFRCSVQQKQAAQFL